MLYLTEEWDKGNKILEWINKYCKKNKVITDIEDGYVRLQFKSFNHMNWFQRKINPTLNKLESKAPYNKYSTKGISIKRKGELK